MYGSRKARESESDFPLFRPQVGPGNNDMDTARALQSDHPEVVMFSRRCLGDAAGLYAKAKALADAGNDQMAVKVCRCALRRCGSSDGHGWLSLSLLQYLLFTGKHESQVGPARAL